MVLLKSYKFCLKTKEKKKLIYFSKIELLKYQKILVSNIDL